MPFNLVVSDTADHSIDDILSYIDKELKNSVAALSWLDRLEMLFEKLVNHPEMFPLAKDPRIAVKGIRVAPLDNYVIAYKANGADETVFIVNVFYGGRDYEKYL